MRVLFCCCSLATFYCKNEDYIDDDTIRVMMELFAEHYGTKGQYVFVAPSHLRLWISQSSGDLGSERVWDAYVHEVTNARALKVFIPIAMPSHWGVMEVDMESRTISTGDSLGWPCPPEAIEAVQQWLLHCRPDITWWRMHLGRFRVSSQPAASGSCGVNALNAIETAVNPRVETWRHDRSLHQRVRLLRLVTRFRTLEHELELDELCREPSTKTNDPDHDDSHSSATVPSPHVLACTFGPLGGQESRSLHKKRAQSPSEDGSDYETASESEQRPEETNEGLTDHGSSDQDDDDPFAPTTESWEPTLNYIFPDANLATEKICQWARSKGFEVAISTSRYHGDKKGNVLFFKDILLQKMTTTF